MINVLEVDTVFLLVIVGIFRLLAPEAILIQ